MHLRPRLNRLLRLLEQGYEPLSTIEISSQAILSNYDAYCQEFPNNIFWPVIKSNAYGHGLETIVRILKDRQFQYFVADSYYEALKIWSVSSHPVLIIGSTLPQNYSKMDFSRLALMVQDKITLEALASLRKPIKIHLKINTGLNRQGIDIATLSDYLIFISKHPFIELEGIMSHLADADNPKDKYTPRQLKVFDRCLSLVNSSGFRPKFVHLSATAGVTKICLTQINTVRLGLGLYGYGTISGLQPALTFKSVITQINHLKKGDRVGYNLTYTAPRSLNYAVIPVGYFEGLDRRLSNLGFVKYQNTYLPIIGRISMNLTVVNLLDTHPQLFDPVEIISSNPSDKNSLPSMANQCDTIPYDLLVHLTESVRRVAQ
ncbi:MAG: alanine racemase [Candidatus Shapirobacteria bacterium]|jgi:alanine racemase